MKKILIATVAAVAMTAGAAQAADMSVPMKAPIAPAPVWSWTGFYLGGAFGYGVADLGTTALGVAGPIVGTIDNGAKGWTGQVKAGFDYQFGATPFGNIVAGVFGDWDPSAMRGNFSTGLASGAVNNPIDGQEKINSSWAVGGRIGFLAAPAVLTYINGGYTSERLGGVNAVGFGIPGAGGTVTTTSLNEGGWFTGGGFEAPVTIIPIKGLFFYTEYRYSVFNTKTAAAISTGLGGIVTGMNVKTSVQTVVSGLDYRFNWH